MCLDNMKYFSWKEQNNDPLRNQRGKERGSILGVKDPLDTQLWDILEKLKETVTTSQDNIHDVQVILLTEMNIGNRERSLQNSSIDRIPKIQGSTSWKVSNDRKVEKNVTWNDLQNSGKKDVTKMRKYLQRVFNRLCSLMSDLLNSSQQKVSPKPLETNAHPEVILLTQLQLITMTNALAGCTSGNPIFRRILTANDPLQIRCYNRNETSQFAKYCRNRANFPYRSCKSGHPVHKHQKQPSCSPTI